MAKLARLRLPKPQLDLKYLLNADNKLEISENIKRRKGIGDIDLVHKFNDLGDEANMLKAALKIPNKTHPDVEDEDKVLRTKNWAPLEPLKKLKSFDDLARISGTLRTNDLSHYSGEKSYYLIDQFAELEQALVRHAIDKLVNEEEFRLVSVPDIVPRGVVERCGVTVDNLVYTLDVDESAKDDLVLSGTAEMALGGFLAGRRFKASELPLKLAAVSRCFRAEVDMSQRGIYRVHQFTKVEMFAVTTPKQSDETLLDFLRIEEELFSELGLAYRAMEMSAHELGAPAHRKFDVEAWLPAKNEYGEVSSCSDCTDFQSRRLNIRLKDDGAFCHTVNGTACAIPRMLMAICEQRQLENALIAIPPALKRFMSSDSSYIRHSRPKDKRPAFHFHKSPKFFVNKTIDS